MAITFKIFAVCAASVLLGAFPATAEGPQLTVEVSQSAGVFELSDAEMAALPQVHFKTKTPWEEGETQFDGPSLKSVLSSVNAKRSDLTLVALNDYRVTLKGEHIHDDWPIIARLKDGEPMSVRSKGPYWLIFPFDDHAELQNELFYSYSIWQLSKIIVE